MKREKNALSKTLVLVTVLFAFLHEAWGVDVDQHMKALQTQKKESRHKGTSFNEQGGVMSQMKGTARRFGKGSGNLLGGVLEIPKEVSKEVQEGENADDKALGAVKGMFTGPLKAVGKMLNGMGQMVTAPVGTSSSRPNKPSAPQAPQMNPAIKSPYVPNR